MLGTALVACALAMAAILAQVDAAPQTRASVEQERLSMNAPPSTLMDELDRVMQSAWTERIPNRRYARIEPVTTAATPAGNFAGELFEESQPLPISGTKAPTVTAALSTPRHRALLLLDLYATVLVLAAIGMTLVFVRNFDVGAPWQQNRFSLVGTSAILAFVAAFCFQASARLWGRFNFESILTWVEMVGSYQTSRIGTGNNFSSRMNTENNVVRTEAMTLRVWRARIESVVFGKDEARQVTAMFSTEQEAKALAAQLMQFARSQSVLVAPFSGEDEKRIAALNAGERAMDAARRCARRRRSCTATCRPRRRTGRRLHERGVAARRRPAAPRKRFCSACGTEAQPAREVLRQLRGAAAATGLSRRSGKQQRDMRILVIGGGVFLGAAIARQRAGARPRGHGLQPRPHAQRLAGGVEAIVGDRSSDLRPLAGRATSMPSSTSAATCRRTCAPAPPRSRVPRATASSRASRPMRLRARTGARERRARRQRRHRRRRRATARATTGRRRRRASASSRRRSASAR